MREGESGKNKSECGRESGLFEGRLGGANEKGRGLLS